MDLISKFPGRKMQKIASKGEALENLDRISSLPNNVLHHILSLLTTKEVVATSVLSTAWQYLWMSVPNLKFDSSEILKIERKSRSGFTLFVERVLFLHSSSIKVFSLKHADGFLDEFCVTSWICAALGRQVEEIDLSLAVQGVLMLPSCICTSETLTVLKLEHVSKLMFPVNIRFSILKILHLSGVVFPSDSYIEKLLAGLLVVEELKLENCNWKKIRNVTISIPTLLILIIDVTGFGWKEHCKIKVAAEKLTSVSCRTDLSINLVFDNLSPFVDTSICVESKSRRLKPRAYANFLVPLLGSAQTLKVSDGTLEVIYDSLQTAASFPRFLKLTSLEVTTELESDTSALFLCILMNSPVLKHAVVGQACAGHWVANPLLDTAKVGLKTFCIQNFSAQGAEFIFLGFLLKISPLLERLTVYCDSHTCRDATWLTHTMHRLSMMPRSSNDCLIELFVKNDQK